MTRCWRRESAANSSLKWVFFGAARESRQIPRPLWMIIEAEKGYFGLESGKFAVFCPSELPPLMDPKLLVRLLFSRSVV